MAGLSLWLVPGKPACTTLEALIATLAHRVGTPPFMPHVTLVGRVGLRGPEARKRARDLAGRLPPVPLRLTHVSHGDEFYRCVVLEVLPLPELMAAREEAALIMGSGSEPYRPHLSLVYGHLAPEQRESVAAEVRGMLSLPLSISADRVELHATAGPPADWTLEGTFRLAP
jgi:2'-5' RNA ligase